MKRSNMRFFVASIATMLLLSSCSSGEVAAEGKADNDKDNMVIEHGIYTSNLPLDLPVIVAKDRGIFAEHGLTVETTSIDSGTDMVTAIVSGSIDIGNPATPPAIRVFTEQGADLGALGGGTALDFRLVTNLDFPMPPDNASLQEKVQALEGKTVMVIGSGTLTDWWLRDLLKNNDMSEDDLTIIPASNVPSQIASLESGDVDAIVAFGAAPAHIGEVDKDYQILIGIPEGDTNDAYAPHLQTFIAATHEWQEDNPDAAIAYCRALAEAVDWIQNEENHDEVVQAMAEWTQLAEPDAENLLESTRYQMHLDEQSWAAQSDSDQLNFDEDVNASCNSAFAE